MSDLEPGAVRKDASEPDGSLIYRHRLSTRLWHWTNAIILLVMLMSGLMIFNAHPRLYWGQYGANPDVSWLEIGSDGERGFLRVGQLTVNTTGVLGLWHNANGQLQRRAFPSWATIPSSYNLALSRLWHLTFAWLLAGAIGLYAIWSLFNGHLRRDLVQRRAEVRPGHIFEAIKHHATLTFPRGEAARNYNILR